MTGVWAQLFAPKLLALLGLGFLGFGGLMIALRFAGHELPPPPSRAALQELQGRVLVVTAADSGIYNHSSSRMQNALEGWQVSLDPGKGAAPVTVQIGDWPPFGSSRSLDLARVERLLPKGALVKAYVHDGPLVWHLECEGRVLVDIDARLAARERNAALDIGLMVALPLLGLLLCALAAFAWLRSPAPEHRRDVPTDGEA